MSENTRRKEIQNYGVWFCRPIKYTAEREKDDSRSPHINLTFQDKSAASFQAAINVKSVGKESRLVYWFNNDLDANILDQYKDLSLGFHPLTGDNGLDFIRQQGLLTFRDGILLEHDVPGNDNDVIDKLTPLLDRSIKEKATIYIFGSRFPDGKGIHDIHMNQGSLPKFENGVYRDGGIFFHFEEDDSWQGVFLAFASQRVPTDDTTGLALPNSKSLAEMLQ
ncbi:hypothetical protein QFC21_004182 [Naganishia friedmannii]|uniref:Uncharacterized protein n=1 Tax=Naganishia friedmannii TaxID=89922 RepID=A0ACC2VKH0_9TREE|nr:hypothetical protein QFC21_004182 [Naganishia friedmannii]